MIAARQIAFGRGGRRLPYLRRVAYLESHGTEYIDTGVIPQIGDSLDCDFSFNFPLLQTAGGCLLSSGAEESRFILLSGKDKFLITGGFWYKYFSKGAAEIFDFGATTNVFYHVSISSDGTATIGDMTVRSRPIALTNTQLFIFKRANNANYFRGRLKLFNYFRDSVSLLSLIPVLDLSGRPSMYDEVSGQFFYNQGTGEFTWGELDAVSANGGGITADV